MIEGLFVVLEGIDGVGTTTHTRRLVSSLAGRGLPVHATREPSDGPIGVQIRQILSGRLVVPGLSGPRPPSWTTMALLFAADRLDHIESTVTPNLMDGVTVVSDRYYHSSVAYQSITGGSSPETIEWVKTINRHARVPDLTLVLDVPDSISEARRAARTGRAEIYDDADLQRRLAAFYRSLPQHFPGERIEFIDANRPVDVVAQDIAARVANLRGD
jgi:dTMP kinase